MDDNKEAAFKPPYGSFRTFWSFVGSLANMPLPPQIDRSMLDSKSGTDQLAIFSALKAFNLVAGENQAVQPGLVSLVESTAEGRKTFLRDLLVRYYPGQLGVSAQQGTEKMLVESFEADFGLKGDTRRKAATWFLHAALECGLPLSPHFPRLRPGQGTPAPRVRRPAKRKPPQNGANETANVQGRGGSTSGDEVTVRLRAGGTVTLKVDVGHFALSRHKDDRDFVQKLMDALTDYEAESGRTGRAGPAEEPGPESAEERQTQGE